MATFGDIGSNHTTKYFKLCISKIKWIGQELNESFDQWSSLTIYIYVVTTSIELQYMEAIKLRQPVFTGYVTPLFSISSLPFTINRGDNFVCNTVVKLFFAEILRTNVHFYFMPNQMLFFQEVWNLSQISLKLLASFKNLGGIKQKRKTHPSHLGPDRYASKIYHAKDLASHDFGQYLIYYPNLPNSHICLAKSMAMFLPNFQLVKSLAWQILDVIQAGPW